MATSPTRFGTPGAGKTGFVGVNRAHMAIAEKVHARIRGITLVTAYEMVQAHAIIASGLKSIKDEQDEQAHQAGMEAAYGPHRQG